MQHEKCLYEILYDLFEWLCISCHLEKKRTQQQKKILKTVVLLLKLKWGRDRDDW